MSKRAPRAKPSAAVEARLLIESRRRCCLCIFLAKDWSEKQVQFAHISRDRSDSSYKNLVVLCLNRHDQYDSRPSQSKGYKPAEIRIYKEKLTQLMQNLEGFPSQFFPVAVASVIGEKLGSSRFPTESLHLRGVSEAGEETITRILTKYGQLGTSNTSGDEWELRTERLGGRSLRVGLYSQNREDWLAWVAYAEGVSLNLEITLDILGQFNSRPSVDIIPHRDSYSLLIRRLTFRGTGAGRHSEIWYVKRGRELVPVLEYPTYAYVSGWCSFDRDVRAHLNTESEGSCSWNSS